MTRYADYEVLSQDRETLAIYETIRTSSELLPFIDFEQSDGKAHSFDRETTLPTTDFYGNEADFAETSPTWTEDSTTLKNIAVQSPLNNRNVALARNKDPLAALKFAMTKSWTRKLEDKFVNGDATANTDEFNGLISAARDDTRCLMMDDATLLSTVAGDETELTIEMLDYLIDLIEGPIDGLIMNKTMRRKIKHLMYAAGGGVQLNTIEMFGKTMSAYDGIPIIVSNFIKNDEQYGNSGGWASSTATTIIAVRFGEQNEGGYSAIHNGSVLQPEFIPLGQRKRNNDQVYRQIAYVGAYLPSPLSIAALCGIDSSV